VESVGFAGVGVADYGGGVGGLRGFFDAGVEEAVEGFVLVLLEGEGAMERCGEGKEK
jgi:hypothetical protein